MTFCRDLNGNFKTMPNHDPEKHFRKGFNEGMKSVTKEVLYTEAEGYAQNVIVRGEHPSHPHFSLLIAPLEDEQTIELHNRISHI